MLDRSEDATVAIYSLRIRGHCTYLSLNKCRGMTAIEKWSGSQLRSKKAGVRVFIWNFSLMTPAISECLFIHEAIVFVKMLCDS